MWQRVGGFLAMCLLAYLWSKLKDGSLYAKCGECCKRKKKLAPAPTFTARHLPDLTGGWKPAAPLPPLEAPRFTPPTAPMAPSYSAPEPYVAPPRYDDFPAPAPVYVPPATVWKPQTFYDDGSRRTCSGMYPLGS